MPDSHEKELVYIFSIILTSGAFLAYYFLRGVNAPIPKILFFPRKKKNMANPNEYQRQYRQDHFEQTRGRILCDVSNVFNSKDHMAHPKTTVGHFQNMRKEDPTVFCETWKVNVPKLKSI